MLLFVHLPNYSNLDRIKGFMKLIRFFKFILIMLLASSFLLMVLNITIYYGFTPSMIHTTHNSTNPFGLTIPLIWIIHLTFGFFGGMVFNEKRFLLSGFIGVLCAFMITGISILYFGWRESIISVEILLPFFAGVLPSVRLYDYLNEKYPLKLE